MGRKAKTKAPVVKSELEPEVLEKVEAKQKQGDAAAGLKKFAEAHAAYDEALKQLPERHSMAARIHACKATVYVMEKRWKEAVKECNTGLDVDAGCIKALDRRSRARYELGLFKDALSDIVKVNSSTEGNEASAAHEEKVRGAMQGSAANGVKEVAVSKPAQSKPQMSREQTEKILKATGQQFPLKVTLDSETKFLHVQWGLSYTQLQKEIRSKWPGSGLFNFKMYYQDKQDNEWVLLTCNKDVQRAQQELYSYMHRVLSGRQKGESPPPAARLKIEKCNRSDVPVPPKEDLQPGEQKSRVVVKSTDMHAEETVIELDEWLIDFANMWRDQMGIDPDKHVDIQTEGMEKSTRALDTVIRMPEAKELLSEAADRFRDVTCMGLSNWANVHHSQAKKLMEFAAEVGKGCAEIKDEFEACISEAHKRYSQALEFHAENVDALLGIGQVHIDEARFAAGLLVAGVEGLDSEHFKELNQEELEELSKVQSRDGNAKLKAALAKVKKEDVEKTQAIWDKVYAQFRKAEDAVSGSKSAKTEEREAMRAPDVVSPPPTDETHLIQNQVKIIWGNALYDQSQIWAGMGLPGWKDMVEGARLRFLGATCKESDVMEALRNHISAKDLDLPLAEKEPVGGKTSSVAEPKTPQGKGPEMEKGGPRGGVPALKGKKNKGGKAFERMAGMPVVRQI